MNSTYLLVKIFNPVPAIKYYFAHLGSFWKASLSCKWVEAWIVILNGLNLTCRKPKRGEHYESTQQEILEEIKANESYAKRREERYGGGYSSRYPVNKLQRFTNSKYSAIFECRMLCIDRVRLKPVVTLLSRSFAYIEQQYQPFAAISLCYGRIGLLRERTGFIR